MPAEDKIERPAYVGHRLRLKARFEQTGFQGFQDYEALEFLLYFTLRKKGIRDSWSTIRERLSCHIRTTTTLKKEDNKAIHIRKTSRPDAWQRKIYQALGIAEVPGRTVKTEF